MVEGTAQEVSSQVCGGLQLGSCFETVGCLNESCAVERGDIDLRTSFLYSSHG